MAPSVSHLPDLCLENIFMRIPLFDLVRSVRVVCTNWGRVVPSELKRRRSLVLFRQYHKDAKMIRDEEKPFRNDLIEHVRREDGSSWVQLRPLDQFCFDALAVPAAAVLTNPIMDSFPIITHLTIVQYGFYDVSYAISSLQQISSLINCYANSIVSLKLVFFYFRDYIPNVHNDLMVNFIALIDSINRLDLIRHLTLNFQLPDTLPFVPKLTVLSSLSTFNAFNQTALFVESFRQYGLTGNVRINCDLNLSLRELNQFDPQLAIKFTSVTVGNVIDFNRDPQILTFGALFASLTRLGLFIGNQFEAMPMTQLARCLSPLTELVFLKLRFADCLPEAEEQPDAQLTQLPSVRLLYLNFRIQFHLDTERLHLSEIFPNLQVADIYLKFMRCREFAYNFHRIIRDGMELVRIEECLRLSRAPFRRCSKLHTIRLNGKLPGLSPIGLLTRDEF